MVDPRARVLLDPTQRGDSHTILSDSATTTDPLKVLRSREPRAIQLAWSSERDPASEPRALASAHTHASDLLFSLAFFPFSAENSLTLAFRLFFTKPRPFPTPALPSRTCGKLPEGSVFPPNRRRSHHRGSCLFPLQGEIHRGDAIRSGEVGAGAACFPSSKARPLATVCRGRTRWLLRRRGWWLL